MESRVTRDGKKNVVVMAWGEGNLECTEVIRPSDLGDAPPGVKLDQIQFTVESGTKVYVGWSGDGRFLSVEGRGLLNYYQFDSLQPSTPGQNLWISVVGEGAFHLVLDCTKMGA